MCKHSCIFCRNVLFIFKKSCIFAGKKRQKQKETEKSVSFL